jgi:OOP family OmpA-OmpF porin
LLKVNNIKDPTMKTKLITLAVAAALNLTATAAFADDEAYQGSWYVLPTLGAIHADNDLETDNNDLSYGVRLGKVLSEHWDVQLGLTHAKVDASNTIAGLAATGDYKQTILGLDALYVFSRDKFRPFVLAGLGVARNNIDYTVGGVAVNGSDTSWMANVGAGFQYFVSDNIGLQADLRHVWSNAEANINAAGISTDQTVGNTYLNFGVIFNFGAPKKVAEVVAPVDPVEPAASTLADVAPQEDEPLPPLTDASAEPVGPAPAAFEKMTLQAEVLFAFDKDTLKDSGKKILDIEVVEKMRAHPEVELVLITGHTDRIGDDNYNQKLSERRAAQVKKYIHSQGIDDSRLHAVGKGEKEPVVDCKGVRGKKLIECLQPNRRVVIEIEAQRQPAQ